MRRSCFLLILILLAATPGAFGSVTGSISGTVKDPSGAVIPGVTVMARNTQTAITQTVTTDAQGFYAFTSLPVGRYDLDVRKNGFKDHKQTNLMIEVNTALLIDVTLQVGDVTQEVTVTSTAVLVETENTQMGEVIGTAKMTALPLDGRSYTDLLALQPGVVPVSTNLETGFMNVAPSGALNPGNMSISGQRETANGFMVNGGNVQEGVQMGTAIIPNLDAIDQFRILTNNFDAEYGNFSGGQVNVITKSGTNQFHGDAFEFLRNTNLDARNFYSADRGAFHQNQFGGTFGGPILHDKVFFFGDYQGTRQILGESTGIIPVPSAAERAGDFSAVASSLTGTVSGPGIASTLSKELGYTVTPSEPYYTSGCTSPSQCVFPNAVIPQSAFSAPSPGLMSYIPSANVPGGFSTSAFNQDLRDDKWGVRIDANTRWGMIMGYYSFDDYYLNNPYASATLPGFSGVLTGRAQQAILGLTTSFGGTTVNEFRFNYVRDTNDGYTPVGGVGPKLSSLGFTSGCDTPGICVLTPQFEGVPFVGFNNYSIGVVPFFADLYENKYQWIDNYSKVRGTHTIKAGVNIHYDQVTEFDFGANNGTFSIAGTETGIDFADFLIGVTSSYSQGYQLPLYSRSKYFGLYGQDSWRVRPNLTFNYGLRWDVSTPWYEKNNQLETIVYGQQSATFPTAPVGWVVPGDPGIPKTVAPVRYDNLAPRVGLAYSPSASEGFLRTLLGSPGQTSIRAGFGRFFTAIEDVVDVQIIGDAPFGYYYSSPSTPLLATPFVNVSSGTSNGQRFPVPLPPLNVSPSNPDPNINWAQYIPIGSSPGFNHTNGLPNTYSYMFSLQRQFGTATVLSMSYVGTQAHHLLVDLEANPGDPALCFSVASPQVNPNTQLAPGTPACGPFQENGMFTTTSGQVINGTRPCMGPDFSSNGLYSAMGNSNFNALEVSLRYTTSRLALLGAYTYSKSLDQSSAMPEQVNPYYYPLTKALSAFDLTNNFVVSYNYELPFDKLWHPGRLASGWYISGITRFSTGLPVTILEPDDHALIGDFSTGPNGNTVDEPVHIPGPLNINNPRNQNLQTLQNPYFNTGLFSPEAIGQLGTSSRRFFHGPGINNWDLALLKDVRLTESKTLQFRAELFNAFNHAQFATGVGASGPQGNILSSSFGFVTSADPPRIGQVAIKFLF